MHDCSASSGWSAFIWFTIDATPPCPTSWLATRINFHWKMMEIFAVNPKYVLLSIILTFPNWDLLKNDWGPRRNLSTQARTHFSHNRISAKGKSVTNYKCVEKYAEQSFRRTGEKRFGGWFLRFVNKLQGEGNIQLCELLSPMSRNRQIIPYENHTKTFYPKQFHISIITSPKSTYNK